MYFLYHQGQKAPRDRSNFRSRAGDNSLRWSNRFPRAVAVIGGITFAALGIWALIAPRSFFNTVARFEPYNQHFLQDIGAFQIGLGAVLLLAALPAYFDGLAAALLGVGIGSALHTVSHIVSIDLGGNPATDIPALAALSILLLVAGCFRFRVRRA